MGETWLWVTVTSVERSTNDSRTVLAGLDIRHWGMGGGHSDQFGHEFAGEFRRVRLTCGSAELALSIRPGLSGWVNHRATSWMFRDTDGTPRMGRSQTWHWLGDLAWTSPTPVVDAVPGDIVTRSAAISLLWVARGEKHVTFKIRYTTMGRYNPKVVLVRSNERFELVVGYPENAHSGNRTDYSELPVVVERALFDGKAEDIYGNGTKLIEGP